MKTFVVLQWTTLKKVPRRNLVVASEKICCSRHWRSLWRNPPSRGWGISWSKWENTGRSRECPWCLIKWKHFPRYWPFVRGIHRSPVNSPHKGQWRGALIFFLICVWTNGWMNNRDADDLRRHSAYHDVTLVQNACRFDQSNAMRNMLSSWNICL